MLAVGCFLYKRGDAMDFKEIEYVRNLRERALGVPFPRRVTMLITNLCNSRCKMCTIWQTYANKSEKSFKDELNADEILRVAENLLDSGVKQIDVIGGEPFLKDGVVELLTLVLKKLGFAVVITNGLQPERYLEKVKKVLRSSDKDAGLIVYVSIDGKKKNHDILRGVKNSYDKAISMLCGLKELCKSYKNMYVGVSFTMCEDNINDTEPVLRYLIDNKLIEKPDRFAFRPAQKTGFFLDEKSLLIKGEIISEIERLQKLFEFEENVEFIEGIKINLQKPEKMLRPCQALFVSCFIDPYGGVSPCVTMTNDVIGNIRDTGYDIETIWNSEKAGVYRNQIKNEKCPVCWTDCHAFENMAYEQRQGAN